MFGVSPDPTLHKAACNAPGSRQRVSGTQAHLCTRLAAGLRLLGVRPGDRVAIQALNSDRYLVFIYACS